MAAAPEGAEVQACYRVSCGVFLPAACAVDAVAMAVADSAAVVLEEADLAAVVAALAASGAAVRVAAARVAAGNEVNGRRDGSGNKHQ